MGVNSGGGLKVFGKAAQSRFQNFNTSLNNQLGNVNAHAGPALFDSVAAGRTGGLKLSISYVEIYNEQCRDLLQRGKEVDILVSGAPGADRGEDGGGSRSASAKRNGGPGAKKVAGGKAASATMNRWNNNPQHEKLLNDSLDDDPHGHNAGGARNRSGSRDGRNGNQGNPVFCGCKRVPVDNADSVFELLTQAYKYRNIAPNAVHDKSSRSHAVFQLHIKQSFNAASAGGMTGLGGAGMNGGGEGFEGVLSMVDLAGSERQ